MLLQYITRVYTQVYDDRLCVGFISSNEVVIMFQSEGKPTRIRQLTILKHPDLQRFTVNTFCCGYLL